MAHRDAWWSPLSTSLSACELSFDGERVDGSRCHETRLLPSSDGAIVGLVLTLHVIVAMIRAGLENSIVRATPNAVVHHEWPSFGERRRGCLGVSGQYLFGAVRLCHSAPPPCDGIRRRVLVQGPTTGSGLHGP